MLRPGLCPPVVVAYLFVYALLFVGALVVGVVVGAPVGAVGVLVGALVGQAAVVMASIIGRCGSALHVCASASRRPVFSAPIMPVRKYLWPGAGAHAVSPERQSSS